MCEQNNKLSTTMTQPHTSHVTQLRSNALANNKLGCIFKPFNQAHLPAEEIHNKGVLMTLEQQTKRRILEWRTNSQGVVI